MRIAICDDEPLFVDELQKMLQREFARHDENCSFVTTNRGEDLVAICSTKKIDAVFLDIAMPGFDGFNAAEQIRKSQKNIMIVFVSSKETTVFDAYEYNPVWFVPKSQMQLLSRAVDKIVDKIRRKAEETSLIQLKAGNEIVEIDIRTIKYFKTDSHYINYFERNGQKSNSFRCKLSEIEDQLSELWFVRTHSRYLVNLRAARSISNNEIVLYDNEKIAISRSQMSIVKEKFQDYLRSIR